MTDQDAPRLDGDDAYEALPPDDLAAMARRDAGVQFRMAREWAALGAERDRIVQYQRMVVDACAATIAGLDARAEVLRATFEGLIKERRAADKNAPGTLDFPGVGKITARKVPEAFRVTDPDAVMAWLSGTDRETYIIPVPATSKLNARAVLDDREAIIARRGGEVIPGLDSTPEHQSVKFKPSGVPGGATDDN